MKDIILQLSLRSIRIHFLRSVLAALGIVIGVVAISSMGMMGANMTLSVTEELSKMANIVVITAASGSGGGPGGAMGGFGGGSDEKISEEEFQDIQKIAEKYGLVYVVYRESDRIKVGDREGRSTIYGLDEDVMRRIFTLSDGAFPKSTASVIVGPTLAERYELKVGSRIKIGDEDEGATTTVKVVGILEERGMSNDINSDMAIIGSESFSRGYTGTRGSTIRLTSSSTISTTPRKPGPRSSRR